MTDSWDDLEDVDDWDAAPDHPPRREPVKMMLLGRGLTLLSENADEWR